MSDKNDANGNGEEGGAQKQSRSPRHPYIGLREAVEKTRTIYEVYKRHDVSAKLGLEKIGLKFTSSSGKQTLASLKSFGLVEYVGGGRFRITEDGARIVGGHSSSPKLLEEAAKRPSIHKELWEKYEANMPPDDALEEYLVFDRDGTRFQEDSAESFIAQLKDTFAFANLLGGDSNSETESDSNDDGEGSGSANVGDKNGQRPMVPPPPPPPPSGSAPNEVILLPEGQVVLQVPETLSRESIEDLEEWFGTFVKRFRRRIPSRSETPTPSPESDQE